MIISGFGGHLKNYLEYYNISQTEFAESLNISKKHLNEILNKNIDMSLELMMAISLLTDIDIDFIVEVERNKKLMEYLTNKFNEKSLKEYLKSFCSKELEKYGWLTLKCKTDIYRNAIDLMDFLRIRNFDSVDALLNNINFKKKDDADKIKVALWIRRCENLTINEEVSEYKNGNINYILDFLKKERNKEFNYEKMVKEFNKYGFYLVIENALPGTKIRGCFKVKKDKPTIFLTKLYKDKASLYFALYHELGHMSEYQKAKSKYIINSDEKSELKADQFALEQMIPSGVWNKIIINNDIENYSIKISKEENIPLSFIVRRLAKEGYIPLSFIVRRLAKEGYIKYNSKFYNDNIEIIN